MNNVLGNGSLIGIQVYERISRENQIGNAGFGLEHEELCREILRGQ